MDVKVPLKERHGFERFPMRLLCRGVQIFCHCKCEMPETIAHLQDPVVFICNHYEIFGPLAVVTTLPLHFRLWMNEALVRMSEDADKLVVGVQHIFPWMSAQTAKKWMTRLGKAGEALFRPFGVIPVDREQPMKLLKTLRESVRVLEAGDNIVIFPETGIPTFAHGGVTDFFPGFAMLGEVYQRRTGKPLLFCPLYVDKKHRTFRFGELVSSNQMDYKGLSSHLHDQLMLLSAQA